MMAPAVCTCDLADRGKQLVSGDPSFLCSFVLVSFRSLGAQCYDKEYCGGGGD